MTKPYTPQNTLDDKPEIREAVLEALRNGESQRSIAKRFQISQPTVHRLAREEAFIWQEGKESPADTEVYKRKLREFEDEEWLDFDPTNRRKLANKGFAKLNAMLDIIQTPQQMQQWWIGFGIATDKRLVEDNQLPAKAEENTSAAMDALEQQLALLEKKKDTSSEKSSVN